jgi:hypothetical protein
MLELQLFWNRMKPKCWQLECPYTSWLSPACGQQQSHRYLIHYRQFVQTCKVLTYHVWWQQCWSVVMHLDGTLQAHMMKNHIISIFSISSDAFAFWVFRFKWCLQFSFCSLHIWSCCFLELFFFGWGQYVDHINCRLSKPKQAKDDDVVMNSAWQHLPKPGLVTGTFPNNIFNYRFHHTALSIHEKFVI